MGSVPTGSGTSSTVGTASGAESVAVAVSGGASAGAEAGSSPLHAVTGASSAIASTAATLRLTTHAPSLQAEGSTGELSCRSRARGGRACAATGRGGPRAGRRRPARLRVSWITAVAQRLGRERHRPAADVAQAGAPRSRGRRAGRARRGRRSGVAPTPRPGVPDGVGDPAAVRVPKKTEKRLQVSIAPPQRWREAHALELREGREEVLRELGEGGPVVVERRARPARRSGTRRRSRPRGSGRRRSGGSSGTGSPCRARPWRRRQPIDAALLRRQRLGHERVVVDRRDVAAHRPQERRVGARRQQDAPGADRALAA